MLHVLSSTYPAIVVDTPRTFDRLVLSTLEQADAVLLVLEMNVPSIRNAIRCFNTLQAYGLPKDRIRLVVNRHRKDHKTITPADVEKQTGEEIFSLIPNDYQVVTAALNFGHTLMADAPNSPVQKAIAEMAKKLMGSSEEGSGKSRRGTGLLGRLFGVGQKRG